MSGFLWFGAICAVLLFVAGRHVLASAGLVLVVLALSSRSARVAGAGATSRAKPRRSDTDGLHKDELTGIASRTALEASIEKEWQRTRKPGEPTALILIGVDEYTQFKEAGGELAANIEMLTLARALAHMLPRGSDLLARHDESSFGVVLPGTDLPGALRVAARLRWTILRLGIVRQESASPEEQARFLSASMGVAVQTEPGQRLALLRSAEAALEKAALRGCDALEIAAVQGIAEQALERPGIHTPAPMASVRAGGQGAKPPALGL